MNFYRERSRNSRLLVQAAGFCQLLAEAPKVFPGDLEIAHSAFPLLHFLLTECDGPLEESARKMAEHCARMVIHHGTFFLALDALLRPFGEWKWTDFQSAGDVFLAVVTRPNPIADEPPPRARARARGCTRTRGRGDRGASARSS